MRAILPFTNSQCPLVADHNESRKLSRSYDFFMGKRCALARVRQRLGMMCFFVLLPAGAWAQATLYWSGTAQNPQFGGDGLWNTYSPLWSSDAGSFAAVLWSQGTSVAVLGGSSPGTIRLDSSGISGGQLQVQQNYVINTGGQSMSFASVAFSGAGSNLTLTGGGTFGAALNGGTITLSGAGTTFSVNGPQISNATLVAGDGTAIQFLNSSSATTAKLQFLGSATLSGGATVSSIESLEAGAGVIQNSGLHDSSLNIEQTSGTLTYSGLIRDTLTGPAVGTGKLAVNKNGAGVLVLAGAQKSYTGGTSVSGGALRMGAANVLPPNGVVSVGVTAAGTLDLADYDQTIGALSQGVSNFSGTQVTLGNATLTIGSGGQLINFGGIISGAGRVWKSGAGYQKLSGINTYSGGTTIAGGVLAIGHPNALGTGGVTIRTGGTLAIGTTSPFSRDITVDGTSATITYDITTPSTLSGVISGTGEVVFLGGTFYLTGNNTHSGGSRIKNGTLSISKDAALGASTSPLILEQGTLELTSSFDINSGRVIQIVSSGYIRLTGASTTFYQPLVGAGGFGVTGSGVATLKAAGAYTSFSLSERATVVIDAESALGATDAPVTFVSGLGGAGPTLRFAASMNLAPTHSFYLTRSITSSPSNFEVSQGAVVVINSGLAPSPSGGTSSKTAFVKKGAGLLDLAVPTTLNGPTTVADGTLRLSGGDNVLPVTQSLNLQSPATLDLAGHSQTVSSLSGYGLIALSGGTFISSGSSSFSGMLSGSGVFRTSGGGAFTLHDSPDFTGRFQLEAGALTVDGVLDSASTQAVYSGATINGLGTAGQLEIHGGGPLGTWIFHGRAAQCRLDDFAGWGPICLENFLRLRSGCAQRRFTERSGSAHLGREPSEPDHDRGEIAGALWQRRCRRWVCSDDQLPVEIDYDYGRGDRLRVGQCRRQSLRFRQRIPRYIPRGTLCLGNGPRARLLRHVVWQLAEHQFFRGGSCELRTVGSSG